MSPLSQKDYQHRQIDEDTFICYSTCVGLSRKVISRILVRSLFIQGAWNFKGMQNIGFLFSIAPGIREIHGDNVREALLRHKAFFNTQPYMAPTLMGILLNLEGQGKAELIPKVQPSISGSLAAIGDTFFWATLKPIAALLCLLTVMMHTIWVIVIALILFNVVHLWVMVWGFAQGYRYGPDGALLFGKALSVERTHIISYTIPLLCGMVLTLIPSWTGKGTVLLGLLVFLACFVAGKLRLNVFWMFYGVFIFLLLWTIMK